MKAQKFVDLQVGATFFSGNMRYKKVGDTNAERQPGIYTYVEPLANVSKYSGDVREAGQVILQTRDFMGDEGEALKEWEVENRRLSLEEKVEVMNYVREEWNDSRFMAKR